MTDQQKSTITKLRLNGIGYGTIGNILGISKETVKSFCRRNGLTRNTASSLPPDGLCRNCGAEIFQNHKTRKKIFCSPTCRSECWKAHPQPFITTGKFRYYCNHCGKLFTAYGTVPRKYCSHACYISSRFEKDTVNETQ